MRETVRNIIAVLRGNIVCGCNKLMGRCDFHNIIRIFRFAEIRIDKRGKLILDSGAAIGERCLCTVRPGGILRLGKKSSLNTDCKIVCHERVEIGDGTIFGPNVLIYDHDHVFDTELGVRRKEYKTSPVLIGKNCWIGAGSIILRGTTIGDNSLVAAGSVVKGTFPAGTRIIQKRQGGASHEDICRD